MGKSLMISSFRGLTLCVSMCMHFCVHVGAGEGVCTCIGVVVKTRGGHWVSSSITFQSIFSKQGLSLNLVLTRLAGQKDLIIFLSLPSWY